MSILLKATSCANLSKLHRLIGSRSLTTSNFITSDKKLTKSELPTMVEGNFIKPNVKF
jgi:hypothetical protein